MASANLWWVYLLAREDEGLYVGMSQAVPQRLRQHRQGTAARYTRRAEQVHLLGAVPAGTRTDARRLERRIKQWSPAQKRDYFGRYGSLWARLAAEPGSGYESDPGLDIALNMVLGEHADARRAVARAALTIHDVVKDRVPELMTMMRAAGMSDQAIGDWLAHPATPTTPSPAELIAQGQTVAIVAQVIRALHGIIPGAEAVARYPHD